MAKRKRSNGTKQPTTDTTTNAVSSSSTSTSTTTSSSSTLRSKGSSRRDSERFQALAGDGPFIALLNAANVKYDPASERLRAEPIAVRMALTKELNRIADDTAESTAILQDLQSYCEDADKLTLLLQPILSPKQELPSSSSTSTSTSSSSSTMSIMASFGNSVQETSVFKILLCIEALQPQIINCLIEWIPVHISDEYVAHKPLNTNPNNNNNNNNPNTMVIDLVH
jgi:hypothetical protein